MTQRERDTERTSESELGWTTYSDRSQYERQRERETDRREDDN